MIFLPAALLWGLRRLIDLPVGDDFLCMSDFITFLYETHFVILLVFYMYPGIFTAAAIGYGALSLSKVISTWSQSIRDKEFLVEMRLRNLESDLESEEPDKDSKSDIAVEEEDGLEEEQF